MSCCSGHELTEVEKQELAKQRATNKLVETALKEGKAAEGHVIKLLLLGYVTHHF
jgi:hypothetical protein